MPSADELTRRIEAAIPGAKAEVEDFTGGGDHFKATITAEAFRGLSRIAQHRLVYDIFQADIGGPIHALTLKTHVPPGNGKQAAAAAAATPPATSSTNTA